MTTNQTVVDLARIPLNDASKVRYTDATLLVYLGSAVRRAYELRPDLRIGIYTSAEDVPTTLGGTFPIPDRYIQTCADYISGRAELRDDDASTEARAQALLALFGSELLG